MHISQSHFLKLRLTPINILYANKVILGYDSVKGYYLTLCSYSIYYTALETDNSSSDKYMM